MNLENKTELEVGNTVYAEDLYARTPKNRVLVSRHVVVRVTPTKAILSNNEEPRRTVDEQGAADFFKTVKYPRIIYFLANKKLNSIWKSQKKD